MESLTKYLPAVKYACDYLSAQSLIESGEKGKLLFDNQLELKALIDLMKKVDDQLESLKNPQDVKNGYTEITPAKLKGLPPELLEQLSISTSDKIEFQLQKIIQETKLISLDNLIIEWYHRTNEVFDRHKLNARLYRMVNKGLIYSVPGKKGLYSCVKPITQSKSSANNSGNIGHKEKK